MPRCKPAKIPEGRLKAVETMEKFMEKYSLNWTGMGLVIGKSLAAISQWKVGRSYPDETVVILLSVLEVSHEAREAAGVYRWKMKRKRGDKPRSRPARKNNPPAPVAPVPQLENKPESFDIEKFLEGTMTMWEK